MQGAFSYSVPRLIPWSSKLAQRGTVQNFIRRCQILISAGIPPRPTDFYAWFYSVPLKNSVTVFLIKLIAFPFALFHNVSLI